MQPADNLFLQYDFLLAIEQAPPKGMRFRYILMRNSQRPCGCIYFQSKKYSAYESLNYHISGRAGAVPLWKKLLTRSITFTGAVCGNALLTGDNGIYTVLGLERSDELRLAAKILREVRRKTYKRRDRPRFVLYKDFFNAFGTRLYAGRSTLHQFSVQPNMVLNLKDDWISFEDYLGAMQSKYRVRIRKALKRSEPLRLERISTPDGVDWDRIQYLYELVSQNASFNLFELNPAYWASILEHLGDRAYIYVYWLEDSIVGFFTAIVKDGELDAHFLGYEYGLMRKYDLYLNMLISLVKHAFEIDKRRVVFSRTAMEIKSSVGAEPIPMFCYFEHDGWLARRIFKRVLNSLNPTGAWRQRHPFKA